MPFLFTPTAKLLGRFTVRMTNTQLGAGAVGVIGVDGDSTADFTLPAGWPPPEPGVDPADMVSIQYVLVAAGSGAGHLHFNKTTAPVTGTFRVSILNDTSDIANMELYLRYIHSLIR